MEVVITSIPTEVPGTKLRRERSEGPKPILAKMAITSLNYWAEKNAFPTCKFYDIDMLYPSDDEVEKYFRENKISERDYIDGFDEIAKGLKEWNNMIDQFYGDFH